MASLGHCLCVIKRYWLVEADGRTSMRVRSPANPKCVSGEDCTETGRSDLMGWTKSDDTWIFDEDELMLVLSSDLDCWERRA